MKGQDAAAGAILLTLGLVMLEQYRRRQLGAWLRAKFLNVEPAGSPQGGQSSSTSATTGRAVGGGIGLPSGRSSGLPQLGRVDTEVTEPQQPPVLAPVVAPPERRRHRTGPPLGGLGLPVGAAS